MSGVTAQYPVTADGEVVTELRIRRPKIGDMKRLQKHKDELEKAIHMIANLAEVSPTVVEEMDAADFARVSEVVGGFMDAQAA